MQQNSLSLFRDIDRTEIFRKRLAERHILFLLIIPMCDRSVLW